MPRSKSPSSGQKKSAKKPIEQYEHRHETRVNNPPVGLVKSENDPDSGKKAYDYDPHLDPQLAWAGKAEHTSFEVPTVSLHVHERIDPKTILEAVKKKNGEATRGPEQLSMFERPEEKAPLREALDFYKHAHGWSNRMIAGDSLLVMNSLLEKEGMAGKVQMVYLDPPYGIRYGSNFQPFVNRRDVKDRKDDDLTQEPEMIRAFRDTWELGIHSYLTYLRDRLLLTRELLQESGSVFVQIGPENAHRVRAILDEIFGTHNACTMIVANTTSGFGGGGNLLSDVHTHLLWFAKDRKKAEEKYRPLFISRDEKAVNPAMDPYDRVEFADGSRRKMTAAELDNPALLPPDASRYQIDNVTSIGFRENTTVPFEFEGRVFHPGANRCWSTTVEGMKQLAAARRLEAAGNTVNIPRQSRGL